MVGEHEVVGGGGAVPVGVSGRDDADVVGDDGAERGFVVGVGAVRELHHLGDAERQKKAWARAGSDVRTPMTARRQRLPCRDDEAADDGAMSSSCSMKRPSMV